MHFTVQEVAFLDKLDGVTPITDNKVATNSGLDNESDLETVN
jgi:hypothetical protein